MHQKMSRGLKFQIKRVEELHCLCFENKDDNQLGGDHEANLCLCSRIVKQLFLQIMCKNLLIRVNPLQEIMNNVNLPLLLTHPPDKV